MENNNRIYLDTEYAFSRMSKDTGRPTSKDLREIVQVAALKFDTRAGQESDSFDMLIKPSLIGKLPYFFTELTGITPEEIDTRGQSFEKVMEKFVGFCKDDPVWTFDKDWEVLGQNYSAHEGSFPFKERKFTRVKALLPSWGLDPELYSSGTLYKAAGLDLGEGHVHNALHDVRSMARSVYVFEKIFPGIKS